MKAGTVKKSGIFALSFVLMASILLMPAHSSSAPQQPVNNKIENPAALDNFFRALTQIKSGRRIEPVRVMHYGDSHTAADILTAEIRRNFQRDFGDGGAGYISIKNQFSTRRRGVETGASSGWTIDGIGTSGTNDGIYGLSGFSMTTMRAGESAWLETICNHFELYYLRQPGGGTIDILVDGVSVLDKPLSLNAPAPAPDYFTYDAPSDRNHRIEIRTTQPGKTRIFGIVTEHIAPGISYDVLGINGARANRLLSWNDAAFVDNVYQRKPDLIIIAYGTNEVTDGDWSVESYSRMFANILRRFRRAAPQASILVYGPPDRGDVDIAGTKMPAMIEAQRRAASEVGAAFWSSYAAMGGAGSMNTWVQQGLGQGDRVHLTRDGYIRMGSMFYNDLMGAYNDYKSRVPRSQPRRRA